MSSVLPSSAPALSSEHEDMLRRLNGEYYQGSIVQALSVRALIQTLAQRQLVLHAECEFRQAILRVS